MKRSNSFTNIKRLHTEAIKSYQNQNSDGRKRKNGVIHTDSPIQTRKITYFDESITLNDDKKRNISKEKKTKFEDCVDDKDRPKFNRSDSHNSHNSDDLRKRVRIIRNFKI